MVPEAAVKQKREEDARGRRNQRREEEIRPEKYEHSPTVSQRSRNRVGFYSEDWDELQEEQDDWQVPHKCRGFHRWCLGADVWKYILMDRMYI